MKDYRKQALGTLDAILELAKEKIMQEEIGKIKEEHGKNTVIIVKK